MPGAIEAAKPYAGRIAQECSSLLVTCTRKNPLAQARKTLTTAPKGARLARAKVQVSVKETMIEYYEQGRESLQDLNQTLEAQIRERPLQTLLVAGGIGLLLGLLWRRS